MTKKTSYNGKPSEELSTELAKLKAALKGAQAEKIKTGKAKEYRGVRKNIARVLTAMNHVQNNVSFVMNAAK